MTLGRVKRTSAIAVGALMAVTATAQAGGLAVREQSASSQGASFAGASAGGDLSSSFWNPAAAGIANGPGLHSESHYSLIVPHVDVKSSSISINNGAATTTGDSISLDRMAMVGASYYAYRWNSDLVLGLAINSPFGLANETSNDTWSGQYHFRSARLLTVNANPMLSYRVAPGLMIGAGVQVQYAKLSFKSNPSSAFAGQQANQVLDGDDIGFGLTTGLLWQPSAATSVGLGYRSRVNHKIQGAASMANGLLSTGVGLGTVGFSPVGFDAELSTPDIVNLSIRQAVAPNTRLLGSIEWTNWSIVDKVDFIATARGGLTAAPTTPGTLLSRFDFNWNDGWLFSLGGEYDWSRQLTLRGGLAYEISPIRDADMRKANITDADRVWLSVGANYKWSQHTSLDFAYSHVFFEDAAIDQRTTSPQTATTPVRRMLGSVEQSGDIVSMSLKTRW